MMESPLQAVLNYRVFRGRLLQNIVHKLEFISRSRNLTDEEIGEPFMEVVLEEGDLLYFPRGVVHQVCISFAPCFLPQNNSVKAVALPDAHSLHITLSTFQKHSFVLHSCYLNFLCSQGDLLEKLMPKALSQAFDKCIAIRRVLYHRCFRHKFGYRDYL